MDHKTKGKIAEDTACKYLENQGFEIVERNYRSGYGEIDIIGLLDNNLLVFFEVKFRKSDQFGYPEEFVSTSQQEKIIDTAESYIFGINWSDEIRFDVLSVDNNYQIFHFESAF